MKQFLGLILVVFSFAVSAKPLQYKGHYWKNSGEKVEGVFQLRYSFFNGKGTRLVQQFGDSAHKVIPSTEMKSFVIGNDSFALIKTSEERKEFLKVLATGKVMLYERVYKAPTVSIAEFFVVQRAVSYFQNSDNQLFLIKNKKNLEEEIYPFLRKHHNLFREFSDLSRRDQFYLLDRFIAMANAI